MISLLRSLHKQPRRDARSGSADIDVALLDSRVLFSATPLAMTVETAEDAPDFDVDLNEMFTIDDGNSGVTFEIQSESAEHIQSLTIGEDGLLQISLNDDANGLAEISVLASLGELTEELNLTLDIESVNDSPDFVGFNNVQTDGNTTTIDLFDAFEDVEDADSDLTFAVSSVSDHSAFASMSIDQSTGILTLVHSADASGSVEVTVTATDSDGLTTGNAAPEDFLVYDHLSISRDDFPVSPDELGLTKLQFWTGWYFFDKVDGKYDYSQLDAEGFEAKILQYAHTESKIMFDIENDYYVNTPEGRDRFAEVLHIAKQANPDLDVGMYRYLPERQWWNSVNWARAQEDAEGGFLTYYTTNYDHFEERYEAWHARNELYRTETVSEEFGGQTLGDMVDTVYPSLYTFFWDNTRTSTKQYYVDLDSETNTLTTADPKYLEADWVYLRATGGWMNNGLFQLQKYYIINRDGNSFQLAHTQDGEAIEFDDSYYGDVHAQSFDVWDMRIDRNMQDWHTYARENLAEARKFEGKDVVPWISPSVYGQGEHYISGDFFRSQLETVKELADSVSLFDFSGTWQNQGWWTAVTDFMESLKEPAATLNIDLDGTPVVGAVPAPQNDVVVASEDQSITIGPSQLLANDVNADGLQVHVASSAANGTLTQSETGEILYRPNENFHGIDSFTYTLTDGTHASNAAQVLINVESVNDAPIAEPDQFRTLDAELLTITQAQLTNNDSDVDSSSLEVEILTGPNHGVLTTNANGDFSYQANDGFSGTDRITYRLFDGTDYSDAVTASINVVSTITIANADEVRVDQGAVVEIATASLLANDEIPASATESGVQIVKKPKYGKISWASDGNSLTYTPNTGFSGTETIEYKIVTDVSESNVASLTIHVDAVDLPEVIGGSFKIQQGGGLNVSLFDLVAVVDLDGKTIDDLSFEMVDGADHGVSTFTPDNRLHYSPARDFHGVDTIQYRVSNGELSTEVFTLEIEVAPRSAAPEAVSDSFEIEAGTALDVSVAELLKNDRVHGAFGGDMSVELVGVAAHGEVAVTTDNRLVYRPSEGFVGTDRVHYRVVNANGTSSPVAIDFVVTESDNAILPGSNPDGTGNPEPAPVAVDDSFELPQRGGLNISVEDLLVNDDLRGSDLGDGISVEIVEGPEHGRATITPDNRLHYSPGRNFSGTDHIEYRLVSEHGTSDSAVIEVVVNADVELAPKSIGAKSVDSFGIKQGGGLNIAVSALLQDIQSNGFGSVHAIEISDSPDSGVATITPDGRLHYSPATDFMGKDQISFRIEQADGAFTTKSIELVVYPKVDSVNGVEPGQERVLARRESPRQVDAGLETTAFELAARRSASGTIRYVGSEPLLDGTSADGVPDRFETDLDDDESESELLDLLGTPNNAGTVSWAAKLANKVAV